VALSRYAGAILFECTNMCPLAKDVAEVSQLPVFDINTMINFLLSCGQSNSVPAMSSGRWMARLIMDPPARRATASADWPS
jgi:hypothetical protein